MSNGYENDLKRRYGKMLRALGTAIGQKLTLYLQEPPAGETR